MATNTGEHHKLSVLRKRSQTYNPVTDQWVKRDIIAGNFMTVKNDGKPFKGSRKE